MFILSLNGASKVTRSCLGIPHDLLFTQQKLLKLFYCTYKIFPFCLCCTIINALSLKGSFTKKWKFYQYVMMC